MTQEKGSKIFGLEKFELNSDCLQKLKGGNEDGGLCMVDNVGASSTDDSGGLCVVDNVDL